MKLKLRNIFIAILAVTSLFCLVFGLAACDTNPVKRLEIENARTEFKLGDEFELGENFTVYAVYGDGTRIDVTEEVEIRKDIKFDMNTAGNYMITVCYSGKKESYTIYVGAFDNILKKIELDTSKVQTQYKLGESISFANIVITSTLENAQGNEVLDVTSSLKGFTVTIENDASGKSVEEVFDEFGGYTITISKGAVRASYTVNVDGVDISSVNGAAVVASAFKDNVSSGNMLYKSGLAGRDPILAFNTDYAFGDNYIFVEEHRDNPRIDYIGKDEEGVFCIEYDKVYERYNYNLNANEAMFNGPRVLLWFANQVEFGAENALNNLYNEAKNATNRDFVETADESTRTYSFSYSGLVLMSNNTPNYYENEVSFTLSENYTLVSLDFTQLTWENNLNNPNVEHTFTTDEKTGITTPNGRYTQKIVVSFTQVEGERNAENPYTREMFIFKSFDISLNGTVLEGENPVINCDMTWAPFTLEIVNPEPSTADFDVDMLFLNYEGSFNPDSSAFIDFDGLYLYHTLHTNRINVRLNNGGVWKVLLKTKNYTKTITFNVTGVPPTSLTPQIRNEATGAFYNVASGFEKLISINGEAYFTGVVNKFANTAYNVEITSENAEKCNIEKVTLDGIECYKFTATEKGKYVIKMYSPVATQVSCTIVIEVGDIPDFASILTGNYKVIDRQEHIFELAFTPTGTDGDISGTFTVKRTPTSEDGTPLTDEAKTETYSYSVDMENLTINVTRVSGDELGVTLSVNASGQLVLADQYGDEYVLERVTE